MRLTSLVDEEKDIFISKFNGKVNKSFFCDKIVLYSCRRKYLGRN